MWKGKQHLPNANRINKEDEQTRAGTHQHVMLFTVHQLTVKRVNWNDNYNYNMSLLEYIHNIRQYLHGFSAFYTSQAAGSDFPA